MILFDLKKRMYKMGNGSGGGSSGGSGGYGGMYGSPEQDPLNDPTWKTNAEIVNDPDSWTKKQKQGEQQARGQQQAAYEAAKAAEAKEQAEKQKLAEEALKTAEAKMAEELRAKKEREKEIEQNKKFAEEHPFQQFLITWLSRLSQSSNLLTSAIGTLAHSFFERMVQNEREGKADTTGFTSEELDVIKRESLKRVSGDKIGGETADQAAARISNELGYDIGNGQSTGGQTAASGAVTSSPDAPLIDPKETETPDGVDPDTSDIQKAGEGNTTQSTDYSTLYSDYADKVKDYATKQKANVDSYTSKNATAVNDYKTNVNNAAQSYKTETGTNVTNYKNAMDAANTKYENTTNAANQEYNKAVNQYTGNAGYQNSVDQAKKTTQNLASAQANQAANAQRTAMRNAGQSSNAAAILAGNNVVNTYQKAYTDNFNTQQQQVASQGQANVQGKQQNVNNVQATAQNVLNTTTQKEANALNVLQDTAKTNLNTLTAAEQNALSQKTATALEELKQNVDLLNTEVEYQGKLISMKSAIEQYQRLVNQWQIALEQYNTEKDATKKAEIWTNISNILGAVKGFWSLFDTDSSETGSSYTKEGLQLVGEAGPEIVELPEGSRVVPASVTKVVIKSDNPKEMIDNFFETHNLKNEVALAPDYNPASDCISKIDMFIKKNKKKDWSKLKEAGVCDKDYKDCMKSLDELFKNN